MKKIGYGLLATLLLTVFSLSAYWAATANTSFVAWQQLIIAGITCGSFVFGLLALKAAMRG